MLKQSELVTQIRIAKANGDFIRAGMLQAELDELTDKSGEKVNDDIFNIFGDIFNPKKGEKP